MILQSHHIRGRNAVIEAAKGIWGRDAWKWLPATAYVGGQLAVDPTDNTPQWHLYRALSDFTSGASFNAANWEDLGQAGDGVTIDSIGGTLKPKDVGKFSKRTPLMLFSVVDFETDQQAQWSNTRFACWIICENSRAPNRWECAMNLASMVESWLEVRSCQFSDIADSPILNAAESIKGGSMYSTEMETKGVGIWVVQWWQKVEITLLASDNESLAFEPGAGVGPDGPVNLVDLNTAFFFLLPTEVNDDPDFPDNEIKTEVEIDLS